MKAFVEAAKAKAVSHYGEGPKADAFLFGADFGSDWCFENLANQLPDEVKRTVYKDSLLEVVRDWKGFWMNQTQHSDDDYKNYFHRAVGVDANMTHHLASQMSKHLIPLLGLLVKQQQRIHELENVPHGTLRIPHLGSVK